MGRCPTVCRCEHGLPLLDCAEHDAEFCESCDEANGYKRKEHEECTGNAAVSCRIDRISCEKKLCECGVGSTSDGLPIECVRSMVLDAGCFQSKSLLLSVLYAGLSQERC